jgi:hypothetical protein
MRRLQPTSSPTTRSQKRSCCRQRAARSYFSACVDGEIEDAKVADRIMAARGLLEHAAKVPRLFDDLLTGVVELSDKDIGLIATALE